MSGRVSVASLGAELCSAVTGQGHVSKFTMQVILFLASGVVVSLDLSQLIFLLIGAGAYGMVQSMQQPIPRRRAVGKAAGPKVTSPRPSKPPAGGLPPAGALTPPPWRPRAAAEPSGEAAARRARPASGPVPVGAPPPPRLARWDAEVEELLVDLVPTPQSDRVAEGLARGVRNTLRRTIPEVEVVGFASGGLARGKAFGVAVPDVDVVINVSPDVLASRLRGGFVAAGDGSTTKMDVRKLEKSAIRAFTDRLVSAGGFKFRRSAFRDPEPKVTLLSPPSLGGASGEAIPVSIFVNAAIPMYSAALLTECGQMDARARALVLLVRRWAKDRGVCHASKGHLSPYQWSLLAIYFLQVGAEEGRVLPPLADFQVSSGLAAQAAHPGEGASKEGGQPWPRPRPGAPRRGTRASAGDLFKDFFHFYNTAFDWEGEMISVRLGARSAPRLEPHVVVHPDGRSEVAPTIEDPFEAGANLGACLTAASLQRLRQELDRADGLCAAGCFLGELTEPWTPYELDWPGARPAEPQELGTGDAQLEQ